MPASPSVPLWPEPVQPENPVLTPYLLPGDRVRSALVILPGGGYQVRVDHEKHNIARWANSLGLHAFICEYRVKPAVHPAPLHDAQRALRLIRHRAGEWRVAPDRVGVIGFSAGGHLAAAVGNFGDDGEADAADPVARQSGRADAVIACYAVITASIRAGSFTNLLGPDPDPALLQRMSLETTVTERNPPTFLWSTAEDPVVPVEHSLLYALALRKCRVPFALHVYPFGGHGMQLAAEDAVVSDWTGRCAGWLAMLGWR